MRDLPQFPVFSSDNTVMQIRVVVRAAMTAAWVVVCVHPSTAQTYESVGTRAQGMGGAFVAVADDATATWWNPAGLATGAYFSVVLERGRMNQPSEVSGAIPSAQSRINGFAMGFPALGLSYHRYRLSEVADAVSTAAPDENRQDRETSTVMLRSLALSQYGATVEQSLSDHLVVATTVKLVRGGVTTARVLAGEDPLAEADDLDVDVDTRPDLDAGVMAAFSRVKFGASVRNLRQPSFGRGADEMRLKRQARAGVALMGEGIGPLETVSAAFDVDLTRSRSQFGETRHLAAGTEAWLLRRRLGVRAGVAGNTVGDFRPTGSLGASASIFAGVFIDGAWVRGRDESLAGWTASLRVTF